MIRPVLIDLDVGIADNLLQSRNVNNSNSKGKCFGTRPDSTEFRHFLAQGGHIVAGRNMHSVGRFKLATGL